MYHMIAYQSGLKFEFRENCLNVISIQLEKGMCMSSINSMGHVSHWGFWLNVGGHRGYAEVQRYSLWKLQISANKV